MSKIKGKKLSYQQRSVLESSGIKDTRDWLYVKTETTDDDGFKSTSRNSPKTIKMVVQNRVTGEIKKFEI